MGPRGAVAMTTCLPLPGHLLIFLCRSRPLLSWPVVSRVAEPSYWARPGHMTREQGMFAWHYQERDASLRLAQCAEGSLDLWGPFGLWKG